MSRAGRVRRALAHGMRAGRAVPALLVIAALLSGSCVYYNTFYFARKNYDLATHDLPYDVAPNLQQAGTAAANYRKSIDYSKKLLANYPKSKWVDDAYLMWARSLLGTNDPGQSITMLRDFGTRYPDSPLKADAEFYLAVAQRTAHKPSDALVSLDAFLAAAPKHHLVPYAELERARVLRALDRDAEAAEAAGRAVAQLPKGRLQDLALTERAEARLDSRAYDEARADFHALGTRALSDEERFNLLLRESDCLEQARSYDAALALLRDALAHEREPARSDTIARTTITVTTVQPGSERWGRLTMRIGNVQGLQGRRDDALRAYGEVIAHFARQPLAAEAQYRIGYVYETIADDFETARIEYAKVKNQSGNSLFTQQAAQRATNLERLATFRSAGGDTVTRRAEGAFMLAEQYLFELDKPERALAVYDSIATAYKGTAWAAKAINAQAWVMRRKLDRSALGDSLLWTVVRQYPATEGQLAARDYLEARGARVPESLIKLPTPPPPVAVADTVRLTPPPAQSPALGTAEGFPAVPGGIPAGLRPPGTPGAPGSAGTLGRGATGGLSRHGFGAAGPDTLGWPAQRDTLAQGGRRSQPGRSPGGPVPTLPDTLGGHSVAPTDTTRQR